MQPHILPLPPLGANCCLLRADDCPQGLIVDPGGDPAAVIRRCAQLSLTPAAILLTHGHFDHVGGVAGLTERWPGLAVYCHPGDVSPVPGDFTWSGSPAWRPLEDGQVLDLAGLRVTVLHTPGHSPGSVCFLLDGVLLTGDTLFAGSVGRTDLPGGDSAQLTASLHRLAALEGDYAVYPGHGEATRLSLERTHNPYLRRLLP